MDESEFIRRAEQTLQEIDSRREVSGIDADCGFRGTDVREIEFAEGSELFAALSACVGQQSGEAVNPGAVGA